MSPMPRPLALALVALTLAGCQRNDCKGSDLWFPDADGDGYGSNQDSAGSCDPEEGYTRSSSDCEDNDPETYPGALETCDGDDNDCDGVVDEGSLDGPYFTDADGDGYGDPDSEAGCPEDGDLTDWVSNGDDCDDNDATLGDGAWYADADGDGYGDASVTWQDCSGAPTGYVDNANDCDDLHSGTYPGASELCDGAANDCDTANTWIVADEAGTAAFQRSVDGTWTDLTSTFGPGHAGNIIAHELSESGTLNLCEDTWYLELTVTGDDVAIVGTAGAVATVLDAGNFPQHRLITAPYSGTQMNNQLEVRGLTLRGGDVSEQEDSEVDGEPGGGLLTEAPSYVTLEDVIVEDCAADTGGGVALLPRNNSSVVTTTFTNVELRNNEATDGGGGAWLEEVELIAHGWDLTGNVVIGGEGGGVYAEWTELMLADVTMSDNEATNGGGLYLTYSDLGCDTANIQTTCLAATDNDASANGGALYQFNTSSNLEQVTLTDNDAGNQGGGIHILGGGLDVLDADISNNTAGYGGAIYADTTSLTVENATLSSNSASRAGGALYGETIYASTLSNVEMDNNNSGFDGGALAMRYPYGRLTASDTTFNDNTSGRNGGAFYLYGAALSCERCELQGNTANSYGGAAYFQTDTFPSPELRSLEFTDSGVQMNTAAGAEGQAIWVRGDMTLSCTGTTGINPRYGFWLHTGGPAIYLEGLSSTQELVLDLCDFGDPSDLTTNSEDVRCATSSSSHTSWDFGDDESGTYTCP